jgi:NADP-dependent 3-hydroxy acid dehydrogenase YdfG
MKKKTCLVTGVGWGTGNAIVRKFANSGYQVAMLARRDDRLAIMEEAIEGAHAYPCDVTSADLLKIAVQRIVDDLGSPSIVIHNAVGGSWGNFLEIDPNDLEYNFQVNTMALLHIARLTLPKMIENGEGSLICTGNTSAHRGRDRYAGFAPTKAAQRILAQSIARDAGPKGVHVAYVTIDAVIDLRWTRKRAPKKRDDYFIKPDEIANEIFHVAHQPKGAWSFDVEIRPHGEVW